MLDTLSDLRALSPVNGDKAQTLGYYALGDGGGGKWSFDSSNLASQVAADPYAGMFAAPTSDPTGASGAWRRIHYSSKVNPKWWGAKGDDVWDDTPHIQAAVKYLHLRLGGRVSFPDGKFLLQGAASPDGLLNGIVLPMSGTEIERRIVLEASGNATLKAGSDNMVLVRVCRAGSVVKDLKFDGTGRTGVWGIGMIGADRSNLSPTTVETFSFSKVYGNSFKNLQEGVFCQPGPSVNVGLPGYAASGAYYLRIVDNDFNFCARDICLHEALNDPLNYPTRTNIIGNRLERGNVGIDIQNASEVLILGNNAQFFNSTYSATPLANPCFLHAGPGASNIWLMTNEAEACTYDIWNEGLDKDAIYAWGFKLSGVNIGMNFAPSMEPWRIRLQNDPGGPCVVGAKYTQFAELVFDRQGNGTKDVTITTNDIDRARWFNGTMTHFGSIGNINLSNQGNQIQFTNTGSKSIVTTETVGTSLNFRVGTGQTLTLYSAELSAGDNALNVGAGPRRIREYFGVNPMINTSDKRLKKWLGRLSEAEMRAAARIEKLFGGFNWLEAIKEKGSKARIHHGVLAQDVAEILEDEKLDVKAYAFICYDKWEAGEDHEAGDRWGIRYEGLHNFLKAYEVQERERLNNRVVDLEQQVAQILSKLQ